ncbi:rod shape-determining protein RodA [Sulfurimonas sp. MAG313]|nr:FtsW/RodA/SpoVE family cell cycle protein [Sulfurimonas sp. MAG313]MDF1881617.1 rod shape-determining protein RodA [Sulfurimonas sp. MAG313]
MFKKIDRRIITHFDYIIMALILPLILVSGMLIGEVVPALAQKHRVYVFVSVLAFFFFFLFPIRRFSWLIPFLYWFNIGLLIAVEFVGISKLGARRWLELPMVNFTLQPSELIKPAFVLMLAYLIQRNPPPIEGYRLKDFLKLSFFILLPFILIAKEPDLGTAMVLMLLGFGVLFVVGVYWKIWATIAVALVLSAPLLYGQLHEYQKKRIHDFLSEKPSYHVQQSIIAIGSGGLTGNSMEESTQTQMKFLPIASSDFIFAYVVERFGFLGSLLLVSIYASLILHLFSISWVNNDYYVKVVSLSLAFLFFIYMSVNIAMTIGFAPVVGVPLPMFSYGGSSFVNFMIIIAILQNLMAFRFTFYYNSDRRLVDPLDKS